MAATRNQEKAATKFPLRPRVSQACLHCGLATRSPCFATAALANTRRSVNTKAAIWPCSSRVPSAPHAGSLNQKARPTRGRPTRALVGSDSPQGRKRDVCPQPSSIKAGRCKTKAQQRHSRGLRGVGGRGVGCELRAPHSNDPTRVRPQPGVTAAVCCPGSARGL